MPKPYTFPRLFDEVKTIDLSDLKKWKYLKPNIKKSGVITWSRNGVKTSSINITSDTTNLDNQFVTLSYNYEDKPIKYNVSLVSVASNLGKGDVLYFLCPHTGKRCRKLYFYNGYFLHREAGSGLYECQTYSKKNRELIKILFEKEEAEKELYKPYFKRYYNGRPTKRFKKLVDKIENAYKTTPTEITLGFMGLL